MKGYRGTMRRRHHPPNMPLTIRDTTLFLHNIRVFEPGDQVKMSEVTFSTDLTQTNQMLPAPVGFKALAHK
jgi:hypothetical protein